MEGREKQAREFRFEKRWLKEEDYLPRVFRIWAQPVRAKDSLAIFQQKLKNVKKALKGWGANIRGRDAKKKKDLSQELAEMELMEETIILTIDQKIRKSHIQEELLSIYEHEEEFWRQRGREQWLLQGDNNTEFFHRCANGQKRKRMMFSLQNGTKLIQGTDDLLAHATSFYKELFGPQQMSSARLAANVWSDEECLNDADRTELDKPFTEEEIKNVIDQMKKNKAAGPDGFPIEFYQSC
jgi:hypothetical protein